MTLSGKAKRVARTLKEALHDTIHRQPTLSVEAIAEQLDMAPSYLYRSALPDQDTDGANASGVRFPLKQLIPLTRITGDYSVLDYIEHSVGRVAVDLPKPSSNQADVMTASLRAVVEFGDLIKEVEKAISDGTVSRKESDRIAKEGREALQAIVVLLSTVE